MSENYLRFSGLSSGAVAQRSSETANDARVAAGRRRRVLILASHVIQYSSPLFRRMAHDPRLDLQIAYCTLQGAKPAIDPEFGVEVAWDTSVLDGYPWVHVPNRSPAPGLGRFFGLFNPGVWNLIRKSHFDAAILPGYFYCTAWIAIAAAKWSGTPILFVTDSHSLRSWRAQSPWKLRFKKWLVRRIFSLGERDPGFVVRRSGVFEVPRLSQRAYFSRSLRRSITIGGPSKPRKQIAMRREPPGKFRPTRPLRFSAPSFSAGRVRWTCWKHLPGRMFRIRIWSLPVMGRSAAISNAGQRSWVWRIACDFLAL